MILCYFRPGCEWKTRYETQIEMNQQLHMQAIVLSEKIEEAKRTLKDGRLPTAVKFKPAVLFVSYILRVIFLAHFVKE
jgi:Domain of unknown function (DUF4600)